MSYARRIRTLSLEGGAPSRADFFKMIQYHLPRDIELFPNLRSLRLIRNEANAEFFLALSLLLTLMLQSIAIQAISTDCAIATLSHMRFRCSLLEELCIMDALETLPMIDHFVCLRSLVSDSPSDVFDFYVVHSLSRIPHLRKLQINSRFVPTALCTGLAFSQRAEQPFSALGDLTIGPVASLHAASFLLDMITSPSFCACPGSLSYANPEGLSALSTSLARHEHLETLALECAIAPPHGAAKMGDVQALSELHFLTDVRLKDVISQKHTGDITRLTRGWPRLRTFQLVCKPWYDEGSSQKCSVLAVSILVQVPAARRIPRRDEGSRSTCMGSFSGPQTLPRTPSPFRQHHELFVRS